MSLAINAVLILEMACDRIITERNGKFPQVLYAHNAAKRLNVSMTQIDIGFINRIVSEDQEIEINLDNIYEDVII
jgi:hypothetical protein